MFSLLELPCDKLSAYSASCALQRLEQLTGISTPDDPNKTAVTFVQRAVLRDLCDTVVKELPSISTQILETLVQCHLTSTAYPSTFKQSIDDEIDHRLVNGSLTISELCSFVRLLSENIAGSSDRVHNIFVHLASRCSEIGAQHVSVIWPVLRFMAPRSRFILKLLDTALLQCWQSLTADDIEAVCRVSPILNRVNRDVMNRIADWLYMNAHMLTDDHLLAATSAFTRYHVMSARLVNVLERYSAGAPHSALQPPLAAVAMEYCRQQRILSAPLFDRIAVRFSRDHTNYSSMEAYMVVRPFGQLNYRPPMDIENALFGALDVVLRERLHELRPAQMLELLLSCAFTQRFPVNFVQLIFSPTFIKKLQGIHP